VTAIVGLNNYGKSAIFRSLYKLFRNEPEGTTFIRDGETEVEIEVEGSEGIVKRKVRNDTSNESNMYIVNDLPFSKFGRTGIPEEVFQTLNVSPPISFGDVTFDMNFQHQLDNLFLMTGDGLPSLRGKVLGRITGVDVAQRAIQLGASEEKRLTQNQNKTITSINEIDSQLLGYYNIDTMVELCNTIESNISIVNDSKETYEELQTLYQKIVENTSNAKNIYEILKVLDVDFSLLLQTIEGLQASYSLFNQLLTLSISINNIDTTLKEVDVDIDINNVTELQNNLELLKKFYEIELKVEQVSQLLEDTPDILYEEISEVGKLEELRNIQTNLETLNSNIEKKEIECKNAETEESNLLKEKEDVEDELGVCPLCNKPFKEK
jgi:exonuclease SbcC